MAKLSPVAFMTVGLLLSASANMKGFLGNKSVPTFQQGMSAIMLHSCRGGGHEMFLLGTQNQCINTMVSRAHYVDITTNSGRNLKVTFYEEKDCSGRSTTHILHSDGTGQASVSLLLQFPLASFYYV